MRPMNPECYICVMNHGITANLLTTDYWHVILSPNQGYLGRAYVTLRDHKGTLGELSAAEWQDFAGIVKRLETAHKQGLGATLTNWTCLMNNVHQAQPSLPHVHWHALPRYEQPVTINGVIFTDPKFGHHYDRDQRRTVDEITFQEILGKLRLNL